MNFSGAVSSDFLKLTKIQDFKKPDFINFAATDFISIRDSLLKYIKSIYPNDFNYFIESDLGIMFVEIISYMGAVMSMKADMLANENFLSTAKQRSSVRKLLELIGVKLKGPISAIADAQLTFDTPLATYDSIKINPENRVVTITSQEDGKPVSYTLYKVVNGFVEDLNTSSNITLYPSESINADDTSSIFNNLVLQEGSLIKETGTFTTVDSIKNIKLTDYPVVEKSIQVVIDNGSESTDGVYTQVDNIYFASGSNDKIFEVIYDEDYRATVVFGDGTLGTSPVPNSTYVVNYRVGGGSRGNVIKNSINASLQAVDNNLNELTASLKNIDIATGGQNAEDILKAKRYAPLTFRRQDRLVTLEDYAVFSNTFISNLGSVGKATAVTRKAYASANVIDIFLLEKASDLQLQKASNNLKEDLLTAINIKKMATDDVVINDGLIRTLDLVVTINVDASEKQNEGAIISKVKEKVFKYMSPDNRDFGESLKISELNRAIFEIPLIRFSTIDNLDQNVSVDFNEIIQLNNLTINVNFIE